MFNRLFQLLFLLEFCMIYSSGWDFLFNLDEKDKLICYSCKGKECEHVTNNDQNKVVCNKKTQLCWAGFVDRQPYRTCASRYCTPSDFSMDSVVRIETCCRSSLCNSIPLSRPPPLGKSYKKFSSSGRSENSTSTITQTTTISTTTTAIDYFIGKIMDTKPTVSIANDSDSEEEGEDNVRLHRLRLNTSDPHRLAYYNDYNSGVASISSILLFLVPLLLILIF